ncbi:amino acid ABC transporter substrate-binding protein [Rhodovibrio sodomensis]|uniref:Amino acid ABC transporter substrate-binding protein n=1 Tax=Rhodovibrio sodomensis TaxID=1088 RepID=A0ABS1DFJ4_9PROT|nr:ABC transporter substrate-binding protein [Rhodovibrio sodomensis]MBK1668659.1 amino acid ABC transporter substrate-binding protein [Rhodovibrio sodomensis]
MYKRLTGIALSALMAGAAAASPAAAQDVEIGAVMPLTGDLADFGESDTKGVELAVQEINDAGGVLGQELGLSVADTRTSPQAGVDAAKKLVNVQGVAGLVGALSSGVTIPIAKSVSSQAGVPQISNASTSPTITHLEDNGYLFRTVPSDQLQGVVLGNIVADEGLERVAAMYVNNAYGEGLATVFKKQFEKRGGTVTAMLPYEKGKASYRGELSNAADGNPEALLLVGYPQNGITILRQALEEGYFDQFIMTDGMKTPKVVEAIGGQYLADTIGSTPTAFDTAGAKHFTKAYEKAYGNLPPKPFIDTAYDATYLLALAMQAAGTTDGAKVRDALHDVANPPGVEVGPGEWAKALEALKNGNEVNYEGAAGPHDFDENGDVPGIIAHWTFTEDGGVKTIRKVQGGGA